MPAPSPTPLRHDGFSGLLGVARRDITPPVGIYSRNWGAAKHDVADAVHRPFTLTAFTIQERADAPPLVLIAADLCWWREASTEWDLRGALLEQLGLHPSRLLFNLSHTHSGPIISPNCASMPGGEHIVPYLAKLREAALSATREALKTALPGALEWTTGRCDLAKQRDLPDPAKPRLVCGYNPAEPADDTVLVGRATLSTGRVLATLVNYACHPVTLAWENHHLSPDYVGALREVVEARTHAPCLFLQGMSGELAPAEEYVGDPEIADRHGRRLAFAALSALEGMLPPATELAFAGVVESGAPLAAWSRRPRELSRTLAATQGEVPLSIKAEYPPAAEIERQFAACSDRVMGERLRRKLAVRKSLGEGAQFPSKHWVWRIGEAYLACVPHEAYSHLQLELRRRFAPHALIAMNLTNGSMAYLPPASQYEHDLYQVWSTPFERGSLERVTEGLTADLTQLAP